MGQLRTQHVTSGSPPSVSRRWFESKVRHLLDDGLHNRVAASIASLAVVHFPPSAFPLVVAQIPQFTDGALPQTTPALGDSPDGAMIHVQKVVQPSNLQLPVDCRFCHAPVGDLGTLLVRVSLVRGSANGVVQQMWHSSPGSFRVVPALVDFRHNFALQFPRDPARSCEICWCSVSAIL